MMIPASLCFLISGVGVARADIAVGVSAGLVVEPSGPVPTFVPPVPAELPAAPVAYAPTPTVVSAPAVDDGQWVYTSQYGWVYMPYGDRYVVSSAAAPYAYVYYPRFGWRWLSAPWVVGAGPYPYFGGHGPFAYAWYGNLHRAGHPMAVHYAHLSPRPFIGPRAAAPVRPVHELRAFGPHAPARAFITPRPATSRPANVAFQHNPPRPVGAAVAGRGHR